MYPQGNVPKVLFWVEKNIDKTLQIHIKENLFQIFA